MHILENRRKPLGFSLVEVAIALGIASFCLVGIMGLLPVGLKSVKNARGEAMAGVAFGQIAQALRDATTQDGVTFTSPFGMAQLAYVVGGGVSTSSHKLSASGQPVSQDGRLAVSITNTPPQDITSPGRATIVLWWPAQASREQAEGSLETSILYLPKR